MIVFFNADLDQFRKMCLMHFDKQSRCDDVFFIKNTPQFSTQSPFHVSYAACCKDFVDFQIDLFIETDLFPLRSVDCGNSWGRQQEDIALTIETCIGVTVICLIVMIKILNL